MIKIHSFSIFNISAIAIANTTLSFNASLALFLGGFAIFNTQPQP